MTTQVLVYFLLQNCQYKTQFYDTTFNGKLDEVFNKF